MDVSKSGNVAKPAAQPQIQGVRALTKSGGVVEKLDEQGIKPYLSGEFRLADRIHLQGSKGSYVVIAPTLNLGGVKPGDRFNVNGDVATVKEILPAQDNPFMSRNREKAAAEDAAYNLPSQDMIYIDNARASHNSGWLEVGTSDKATLRMYQGTAELFEKLHGQAENAERAQLEGFARNSVVSPDDSLETRIPLGRAEALWPMSALDGQDFGNMVIALKAKGYDFQQIGISLMNAGFKNGLSEPLSPKDIEKAYDAGLARHHGDATAATEEAVKAFGHYVPTAKQVIINPPAPTPNKSAASVIGAIAVTGAVGAVGSALLGGPVIKPSIFQ